MEDEHLDDLIGLLEPLLRAMESLEFVQRHFHPQDLAGLLAAMGEPEAGVAAGLARLEAWPETLLGLRNRLEAAGVATLLACGGRPGVRPSVDPARAAPASPPSRPAPTRACAIRC